MVGDARLQTAPRVPWLQSLPADIPCALRNARLSVDIVDVPREDIAQPLKDLVEFVVELLSRSRGASELYVR